MVKSTQIRWFSGGQAGDAGLREQWPKALNKSPKLKEDYQAQVHAGQIVLVVVRQGRLDSRAVVKDAQRKVGKL